MNGKALFTAVTEVQGKTWKPMVDLKDWAQKWHLQFYTVLWAKASYVAEHKVKGWGGVRYH